MTVWPSPTSARARSNNSWYSGQASASPASSSWARRSARINRTTHTPSRGRSTNTFLVLSVAMVHLSHLWSPAGSSDALDGHDRDIVLKLPCPPVGLHPGDEAADHLRGRNAG